ncbi:hypothetical protein, partial [Cryptosporangium minutisporangium]
MDEELPVKNMRRRPVAFNMDNALEKGLSEWCDQQSPDNFSGFVKMVLFAYKNNPGVQSTPSNSSDDSSTTSSLKKLKTAKDK